MAKMRLGKLGHGDIKHVAVSKETYEKLTPSELVFVRNFGKLNPAAKKSVKLRAVTVLGDSSSDVE